MFGVHLRGGQSRRELACGLVGRSTDLFGHSNIGGFHRFLPELMAPGNAEAQAHTFPDSVSVSGVLRIFYRFSVDRCLGSHVYRARRRALTIVYWRLKICRALGCARSADSICETESR